MLKIPYQNQHTPAYLPPVCEERLLHLQTPVLGTSFGAPSIVEEEDEEDW